MNKDKKKIRGYYFITDNALSRAGSFSDARSAMKAGVRILQYREKSAPAGIMFKEACCLRKICKDALFLINDRVDIALAAGADGVHLGQEDLPYAAARKLLGKKKIIGLTVHSLKEALLAQRLGADYISVAPIFATRTKPDALAPVGLKLLEEISGKIKIPIAAIGGITLADAGEVIRLGVDSICALSAVLTRNNVKSEIEKFQRLFLR